MTFFERVKELVKSQNKTLQFFILELGINYETYISCRRYGNIPRGDDCVRIAQALNTTVEYLVTGVSSNPAETELAQLKQKLLELGHTHV